MFTVVVNGKFESFVYNVRHEGGENWFLVWDPFHRCFDEISCHMTEPALKAPQNMKVSNEITEHRRGQ